MKKLAVAVVLALCALVGGCKNPYGGASKAAADIAQGITEGMNTVFQFQQQGLISQAEALNVENYLEYANKGDEAFTSCIGAAHSSAGKAGTYTACAQLFNSTLNNPAQLALIHVSNPQASQKITLIVNGVTTGVNSIIAALGGQ